MIKSLFLSLFLIACSHKGTVDTKTTSKQQGYPIGIVNLQVKGDQTTEALLLKMEKYVSMASSQNARAILFPELVTFDLLPRNPDDKKLPLLLSQLAAKKNEYEKGISQLARKYNIMIVGANHYIQKKKGFINRAYIVRSNGKVEYQDKIYKNMTFSSGQNFSHTES